MYNEKGKENNNQAWLCTTTGKSTLVLNICNVHPAASLVLQFGGFPCMSLYKVVVDSIYLHFFTFLFQKIAEDTERHE